MAYQRTADGTYTRKDLAPSSIGKSKAGQWVPVVALMMLVVGLGWLIFALK